MPPDTPLQGIETDTPLAQLVLWVPPAIAAGWEHLPAERQRWWTEQLTYFWFELICAPGPEPVLAKCGLLRSRATYDAFWQSLAEIDAKYPKPSPEEQAREQAEAEARRASFQALNEAIAAHNVELEALAAALKRLPRKPPS